MKVQLDVPTPVSRVPQKADFGEVQQKKTRVDREVGLIVRRDLTVLRSADAKALRPSKSVSFDNGSG